MSHPKHLACLTRILCTAASISLLFSPGRALADARLAAIFGKGMVLQQKKPVPIWGWAEPGEEVTVKIAGQAVMPYGIAGFAWYQGESNETNPEPYRKLFPQLITDWRECWGDPNLPFYFCQLPGTKLGPPNVGKRPFLRDAQASALSLPNTGMAVLIGK